MNFRLAKNKDLLRVSNYLCIKLGKMKKKLSLKNQNNCRAAKNSKFPKSTLRINFGNSYSVWVVLLLFATIKQGCKERNCTP